MPDIKIKIIDSKCYIQIKLQRDNFIFQYIFITS